MKETLKILIVEDEKMIARDLQEELLEMGYSITAIATDSDQALLAFRKRIPDLVLMDINLRNSPLDGIEIATHFNQITAIPIIYLTLLSDQATRERAKKTKPAYYLIKPWQLAQLEIAIDFALYNFVHQREAETKHSLLAKKGTDRQVLLHNDFCFVKTTNNTYVRMNVAEFIYAKGASESVEIFTSSGMRFLSANLKSFAAQFPHPNVLRVHRSYIVNSAKIIALQDNFLQLGDTAIPLGPSYKETVNKALNLLKAD